MKCPHCGFVSFEHLDTCKKCVKDLSAHKSQFSIDYLEPVSLGILSFVEGATNAGANDSGSFAADDFSLADDANDGMTVVEVEEGETPPDSPLDDEIAIDATEEVTLDFESDDTDDLAIALSDDDDAADAIASDSGFTLDLGDEVMEENDELAVALDDELDMSLNTGAEAEEAEFEIALEDNAIDSALGEEDNASPLSLDSLELDSLDDDAGEIKVDFEEESGGIAMDDSDEPAISLDLDSALSDDESIDFGDIGLDDLEVTLEEDPVAAAPALPEDDEISLALESDDDSPDPKEETLSMDLDDLSLEIGDDDYDLNFDD